jgi:hypothetical protein
MTLLIEALAAFCLVLQHRVVSNCACKDGKLSLEDEHMGLTLSFEICSAQDMLLACRGGICNRNDACD